MRPRPFCNLIRDGTPAAITTASARALTSQAITRAIEPASPRTPRLAAVAGLLVLGDWTADWTAQADERLTCGLLRAHRERPRRRAAEQRDEFAAPQLIELHSISASQGPIAGYRSEDQSAGR
jgi:hypothetical protein